MTSPSQGGPLDAPTECAVLRGKIEQLEATIAEQATLYSEKRDGVEQLLRRLVDAAARGPSTSAVKPQPSTLPRVSDGHAASAPDANEARVDKKLRFADSETPDRHGARGAAAPTRPLGQPLKPAMKRPPLAPTPLPAAATSLVDTPPPEVARGAAIGKELKRPRSPDAVAVPPDVSAARAQPLARLAAAVDSDGPFALSPIASVGLPDFAAARTGSGGGDSEPALLVPCRNVATRRDSVDAALSAMLNSAAAGASRASGSGGLRQASPQRSRPSLDITRRASQGSTDGARRPSTGSGARGGLDVTKSTTSTISARGSGPAARPTPRPAASLVGLTPKPSLVLSPIPRGSSSGRRDGTALVPPSMVLALQSPYTEGATEQQRPPAFLSAAQHDLLQQPIRVRRPAGPQNGIPRLPSGLSIAFEE